MTPEESYLFDLNGYLILRDVLPRDFVAALNRELDSHLVEELGEEKAAAMGIIESRQISSADTTERPKTFSGPCLKYGEVFEKLIDWPVTLPYMKEMIDEPMRMDSMHFLYRPPGGWTSLHHGYSELLAYSEYALNNNRFQCVSVKIGYALTDVTVENGAFAVIPGSHKSNYMNPRHLEMPEENDPLVEVCPCRAGDAIIFSEDLTHGAVVNRSDRTRRTIFVSYAPSFQAPWCDHTETAEGFAERAAPEQRELIYGPQAFGKETGFNEEPVRQKD